MNTATPQLKWLWLSLGVILIDQVTKQIAEAQLSLHDPVNFIPYFDWYLTYNTGAAFSLLADAGGWQRWLFTVIAIVVSAVIVQWIRKLPREDSLTALSLGLILGGCYRQPDRSHPARTRHRLHPGMAWQLPVSRLQHCRRRDQCRCGLVDLEQFLRRSKNGRGLGAPSMRYLRMQP